MSVKKPSLVVEVTKNDNKYQFIIPVGAQLGEVYDAAFEVLNTVVELSRDAVANAAAQAPSQQEAPEVPAELVTPTDA